MIGLIWLDRVRLRRRKAMREFATRPLLAGRIDPMRGGTRLRLRFRAPLPAYSALAHAFPLLLLMVWFAMLAPNSLGVSTDDFAPLLMAAFVAARGARNFIAVPRSNVIDLPAIFIIFTAALGAAGPALVRLFPGSL